MSFRKTTLLEIDTSIVYETRFPDYPNQESAPAYMFDRSLLQFTQEGVDQVKENVRLFKQQHVENEGNAQ